MGVDAFLALCFIYDTCMHPVCDLQHQTFHPVLKLSELTSNIVMTSCAHSATKQSQCSHTLKMRHLKE